MAMMQRSLLSGDLHDKEAAASEAFSEEGECS